jgi:hypothetical protein
MELSNLCITTQSLKPIVFKDEFRSLGIKRNIQNATYQGQFGMSPIQKIIGVIIELT